MKITVFVCKCIYIYIYIYHAAVISIPALSIFQEFDIVNIRFQEVSRALLWHSGALYNLALVSRASF